VSKLETPCPRQKYGICNCRLNPEVSNVRCLRVSSRRLPCVLPNACVASLIALRTTTYSGSPSMHVLHTTVPCLWSLALSWSALINASLVGPGLEFTNHSSWIRHTRMVADSDAPLLIGSYSSGPPSTSPDYFQISFRIRRTVAQSTLNCIKPHSPECPLRFSACSPTLRCFLRSIVPCCGELSPLFSGSASTSPLQTNRQEALISV
jgi:hypothetical protein